MAITKREKRVKGQGGGPELLTFVIAAVILGLAVYLRFHMLQVLFQRKEL